MSPATALVHCTARSPRAPVQRTYMTHMTRFGRRACATGCLFIFLALAARRAREKRCYCRWRRLFRLVRAGLSGTIGSDESLFRRACFGAGSCRRMQDRQRQCYIRNGLRLERRQGTGVPALRGDSTRQLKCFNPFRSAQQQQGELGPHASRFAADCGAQLARHACAPDGRAVQCGNPTSPPDPGNSGGRVGEQRVSNTQGVRVHLTHLAGMHAVSYSCRCAVAPSRASKACSHRCSACFCNSQVPGDRRIKEPASLSDSPLNHSLYTTSIPDLFVLFVKRPQRPSPFFLLNAPLTDPHSLPCSQRGPCWPPPSLPPLSSPSRRRTSPSSRGRTTRSPGMRSLTWVD